MGTHIQTALCSCWTRCGFDDDLYGVIGLSEMGSQTITGITDWDDGSVSDGAYGYVCPSCGMWVNYGETHFCGEGLSYHPKPSDSERWDEVLEVLRSIEDKLARILQII